MKLHLTSDNDRAWVSSLIFSASGSQTDSVISALPKSLVGGGGGTPETDKLLPWIIAPDCVDVKTSMCEFNLFRFDSELKLWALSCAEWFAYDKCWFKEFWASSCWPREFGFVKCPIWLGFTSCCTWFKRNGFPWVIGGAIAEFANKFAARILLTITDGDYDNDQIIFVKD